MATAAPPTLQARLPPPKQLLELRSREDIYFLHPGYDSHNTLLSLPRVDSTTSTYGVHHRTALLACQIIAGNAFTNSYLAFDKAGQQRVQVPLDDILIDRQYYFIVEASKLYPIVPSFQDWEFPHGRIPDWWPSIITASLSTIDCGITNAGYAVEEAHIVPKEEGVWYRDNEMKKYGVDPSDIDNRANILPLRKNIHYSFDARWFVIIPRIVTTNSSLQPSPQYVTHIISPNAAELWPTYHTTLVGSLYTKSYAYLFARFAWAILHRIKLFVIAGRRRHVIRISRDEAGNIEYKTEYCTGTELENLYGSGGSKAATPLYPRKRKSGRGSTAHDEVIFAESSGDSDIDMEDTDSLWEVMSNSSERGSNRRQESSEETAPGTKVQLAPDIEADLRAALRKSMLQQQEADSED
ncbi:hypothetical protein C7999DRAFT_42400 [Corynascus novoguineensis]|uniref:HNH nuclease domain-containing protein n=1 Tax=Corynascus novoguineensis TaxID=1126955 RepID=A0AAN7CQP7_9PEZI|nr:hypothetical protein C7999DRAFT_42400 [Corynascus novoguineensis]